MEPAAWAKQQFAKCELGDERRTKRLVQIAARPDGSTPDQTESWGDCQAVYRWMDCDDVALKWVLVTSEPVTSEEEALQVLGHYSKR